MQTEIGNVTIQPAGKGSPRIWRCPSRAPRKKHPYSFTEARKHLVPKVKETANTLDSLPDELCPKDRTVAPVTLQPTYLAKSYYPAEFLKTYGLETV